MSKRKSEPPGDSKCHLHPLVGGHLTPWKGHLTIPKRSLWITRQAIFFRLDSSEISEGYIRSSWWWRWHTREHPNFAVPNSIRTPPACPKKKQTNTFTIGSLSQGVGWSSTTVLSLRSSEGKFPARQMKEKVKHANLFQLALKISIGWFLVLEDILNYQTKISTRRSAKTIVDSPATTSLKLGFVNRQKLTLPETNSSPLKIGQVPKKKIHLPPTIAFARAFAVTFKEGHVPPKKNLQVQLHRSMLKKSLPFFSRFRWKCFAL